MIAGLPTVAVARIVDNQYNPRDFDSKGERQALNRLIESIRRVGLLMPPVLYRVEGSRYLAPISGHRRVHAMRQLGWERTMYIPSNWMGLPEKMTDKEALRYILNDQDVTKPYNAKAKVKVIWDVDDFEAAGLTTTAWKMRKYLVKHAPNWLKDSVIKGDIGFSDAYEILRFVERVKDPEWIQRLAIARMKGIFPRRHELREFIKRAESDPEKSKEELSRLEGVGI